MFSVQYVDVDALSSDKISCLYPGLVHGGGGNLFGIIERLTYELEPYPSIFLCKSPNTLPCELRALHYQ